MNIHPASIAVIWTVLAFFMGYGLPAHGTMSAKVEHGAEHADHKDHKHAKPEAEHPEPAKPEAEAKESTPKEEAKAESPAEEPAK